MKNTKVPVTTRALIARINRRLKQRGEVLKTARGAMAEQDCGRHYIIDASINAIVEKDIDPVELAKREGLLKPYERVID